MVYNIPRDEVLKTYTINLPPHKIVIFVWKTYFEDQIKKLLRKINQEESKFLLLI